VAIFSVVRAVVLKPLPFEQPDQLVTIFNSYPGAGAERSANGSADFFLRRDQVPGLEEIALYQASGSTVGEAGEAERLAVLRATPSLFPLLGVEAQLGRTFLEEEMEPGRDPTVVLMHDYWEEQLGGADDVIGQTLRVDGVPTTIVGVLPADFRMAEQPDIRFMLPLAFGPSQRSLENWHSNSYSMIGRLAPGATAERVAAQIRAVNESAIERWPVPNARQILADAGFHTVVVPARDDLIRDVKEVLFLLWGGVGFVLLIGCVNIANLMLARAQGRLPELATRMSLGAERMRLARQILTEALLMGLLGGLLGVGLGAGGLRLLGSVGIQDLPRGTEVSLDTAVLAYGLVTALGASLVFGAIPIVHLFRSDLNSVFREEGRGGTSSRAAVLFRNALVTGQVALAFVLIVGAGLMFRSFRAATAVDPGFDPQGVLSGYFSLPSLRYSDGEARQEFVDRLLPEVRALPGVVEAGVTTQLPFGFDGSSSLITPEGYVPTPGESLLAPRSSIVGPGYLEAMGVELLEGRTFEEQDGPDTQRVIVIDDWLARRYWPDRSPLGQRMVWGAIPGTDDVDEDDLYTIIGVVENIKYGDLTQAISDYVGAYYLNYRQVPQSFMAVAVRTQTDPSSLTGSVREAVTNLDPELPLFNVATLEDRISDSLASRRTPAMLLTLFAGVALFLAVVGIYGVLAYSVTRRTREIGIRMAVGSRPAAVFRLVLRQGLLITAGGMVLGAVGAFLLVRVIQALLFGIEPLDPLVIAASALLLGAAGVLACAVPAGRATRVDPGVALLNG
jgi:predicted permease